MKIIDFEAHFFTEEFVSYMRSRKDPPRFETIIREGRKEEGMWLGFDVWAPRNKTLGPLLDLEGTRLAEMDQSGITMQVLTLAGPGVELFEPGAGIQQARKANDRLAELINRHPDRFVGFAALPAQAPEAAAEELNRAVTQLGFRGAKINSHVRGGEYLDEQKYWIIFETAQKLDIPIYIHPRVPSPAMMGPYAKYGYGLAGAALGFAAETSLHAMRLILSGVFDKYPRLKIILGHLGEALPFWMDRIDRHYDTKVKLAKKPSDYIKDNFLMSFSGMFFMPAFMCVYLALGADNIVFGSDYPFEESEEAAEFVRSLPISDRDKEKIAYQNAQKLLHLP
jgi:predicted TIM-barrel fold metal-dependent hydrolase